MQLDCESPVQKPLAMLFVFCLEQMRHQIEQFLTSYSVQHLAYLRPTRADYADADPGFWSGKGEAKNGKVNH